MAVVVDKSGSVGSDVLSAVAAIVQGLNEARAQGHERHSELLKLLLADDANQLTAVPPGQEQPVNVLDRLFGYEPKGQVSIAGQPYAVTQRPSAFARLGLGSAPPAPPTPLGPLGPPPAPVPEPQPIVSTPLPLSPPTSRSGLSLALEPLVAQYGANPRLVGAILANEGSGEQAVSPRGAVGRFQILPSTARSYLDPGLSDQQIGEQLRNPRVNAMVGLRLIRDLEVKHAGRPDLVMAEYFGGPGAVDNGQLVNAHISDGNLTRQQYVDRGMRRYGALGGTAVDVNTPERLAQGQVNKIPTLDPSLATVPRGPVVTSPNLPAMVVDSNNTVTPGPSPRFADAPQESRGAPGQQRRALEAIPTGNGQLDLASDPAIATFRDLPGTQKNLLALRTAVVARQEMFATEKRNLLRELRQVPGNEALARRVQMASSFDTLQQIEAQMTAKPVTSALDPLRTQASILYPGRAFEDLTSDEKRAVLKATREDKASEREVPKEIITNEKGTFLVDKRTGAAQHITLPVASPDSATPGQPGATPGQPAVMPGRPMTSEQAHAFAFGSRAASANERIRQFEAQGQYGNSFGPYIASKLGAIGGVVGGAAGTVLGVMGGLGLGSLPGGAVGGTVGTGAGAAVGVVLAEPIANLLRSEDEQAYVQAKMDFIGAILRKESGTAISLGEFQKEEARYFPVQGDKPLVIRQKAIARAETLAALSAETGGRPLHAGGSPHVNRHANRCADWPCP